MTIDEAIAHAREVAKEQKSKYDKCPTRTRYNCAMCFHNPKCDEDAKEHEQLAEWLEELKELRNMTAGHLYAVAFNRGYLKAEKEVREKAIDDFAKWLENKKYLMKEIQEHNFCYTHYDELKANYVVTEYFEEQLKVGGKNDD